MGNKLKLAGILFVALIIGVMIGMSGDRSSSTGKVSSNSKEEIQQSTVRSESSSSPQLDTTQKSTGKVEVKSQTRKRDYHDKIVGEVINNTQNSVTWVKVTATFYDLKGVVVGTNFTYVGDTDQIPLAVGTTAPFEVSDTSDTNFVTYKLDVTWR